MLALCARARVGFHLPALDLPRTLWRLYLGSRKDQRRLLPWAGNWMYVAQRWTGMIALLYIAQHVWRQRFLGSLPENPGAAFHKVQVELSNPWMLAFYVIAMIATAGTSPTASGSSRQSGASHRG